ncbi:MAG: PqqD family protein [Proteobacteria bacterium]|jgi:sensor domain CHASE-containing protein|nr:PqqD family protein [Pseudomonadota bacterium]
MKSSAFAWRVIGEEAALVPVAGKRDDLDFIFVLNEVGTLIWTLMDGQHTAAQMIEEIVARFEVSEEEAARDLEAFLAELEGFGAVQETRPDAL